MDKKSRTGQKRRRGKSQSRRRERKYSTPDSSVSVRSELSSRLRASGMRRLKWYEKTLLYLISITCLGVSVTTLLIWKSRTQEPLDWQDLTRLPVAETPPAAISSESDPSDPTHIEPFACRGYSKYALEKLEQILRQDHDYTNVRSQQNQLQAVAITPTLGFHDDLIFQARTDPERIEIYSSSRVGIGDMGANRKRIEELRETLRELILVK